MPTPEAAISRPPTAGPTTIVTCISPKFSASAERSRGGSTRFGTIAERVTFWIAPKPAVSPPSRYSSGIERGAGEGQRRERGRDEDERDLVEQQQPAAVAPVGQRAAEQGHRDERDQLDRAEQAGQEGRAGLDVDLVRQRDQRRLGPEARHDVAEHQQAQVARLAQRCDVDGEALRGGSALG